jgi:hypothetical protein
LTNPYLSLIVNTFFYGSNLNQNWMRERSRVYERPWGINKDSPRIAVVHLRAGRLYLTFVTSRLPKRAELEKPISSLPPVAGQGWGSLRRLRRINAQHPYVWDFADIPLNYRAMIGQEGWVDTGVQFTYLPSLPVTPIRDKCCRKNDLLFNPDGTTPYAFGVRQEPSISAKIHPSGLPSPPAGESPPPTAPSSLGDTTSSVSMSKWKPSRTESVVFQSEYLYRRQNGDLTDFTSSTTNPLKRIQDGLYVQALYQWERWRFGVRYDVLDLFKKEFLLAGDQQNFGNRAWRATGALEFNPSEFSRFRLQYNRDDSAGNGQINNELFFQMLLGIGAHAAHSF